MKKHRILGIALQRCNGLKRRISCFRHRSAGIISLYAYKGTLEESRIVIKLHSGAPLYDYPKYRYSLEEEYWLYPYVGSAELMTHSEIRSLTGKAIHTFRGKRKYYTGKEISESQWIRKQLNVVANWLADPELKRVDPYYQDRVLEGEETEEDKKMNAMLSALDTFGYCLKNCDMKPGIINPERDYNTRN